MSDRQPKPPASATGEVLGAGLHRARELLDRIGRLARQAQSAAEGLAGRLLGAPPQTVAPPPAPAPPPVAAEVQGAAPAADTSVPAEPAEARVVLLSRDPEWLFCYWDLDPAQSDASKPARGRLTLRLQDVTDIEFSGSNGWSQHLYPLSTDARWWHVPVPHRGRHYLAELGYCAPEGTFYMLGRSSGVATIPDPLPAPGEVAFGDVELDVPRTLSGPETARAEPGGGGPQVSGPAPTRAVGPLHRQATHPAEPAPLERPSRESHSHPSSPGVWSRRP